MTQGLARLVDVRAGEAQPATRAFITLFGMIAGHTVLETARDALFLETLPAERLALVYLALAVIGLVVRAYNLRFIRRVGRRNAVVFTLVVAAFGTTLLHFQPITPTSVFAIYLWSGLLATVMVVQFWLLVGQLFTVAQGKRLFGPIAAGGVLGATVGGVTGAAVLHTLEALGTGRATADDPAGARVLLLVAAIFFLATAVALTTIETEEDDVLPDSGTADPQRPSGALEAGERSYVWRIGLLIALSTATVLTTDYLFKLTAKATIPAAELGQFFAGFYAVLNGIALVVQLLVARHLLQRLGVAAALALLPLLLVGGGLTVVLVGGGIVAVLATKGFDGALRHSVNRVSTELLYLPLSTELRNRSKSLLESVVLRTTQAVTATALMVLAAVELQSPRVIAGIVVALAAGWLAVAVLLRRPYLDRFRHRLGAGRLDPTVRLDELDMGSLRSVLSALSSTEEARVVAAMDVLVEAKRSGLIPALIFYHESEAVQLRALELIATADRDDWMEHAKRLLDRGTQPVRIAAVRALGRAGRHEPIERVSGDVSPAVRAHAAFFLASWDDSVPPLHHPLIAPLLGDDGHEHSSDKRADEAQTQRLDQAAGAGAPDPCHDAHGTSHRARGALADALALDGDQRWADVLLALARHHHCVAIERVVMAMARIRDQRFVPALIARLARRSGRAHVREALVQLGDEALAALEDALIDPRTRRRVRLHIPQTIARFGSQQAAAILTTRLGAERDGAVRYKVLRGLGRLVARNDVSVDTETITQQVSDTLVEHLRLLSLQLPLERHAGELDNLGYQTGRLLVRLLGDKRRQALERGFRLFGILHRREDVRGIHVALQSRDRHVRANAHEFLDALASDTGAECRELMMLVADDLSAEERVTRATDFIGQPPQDAEQALEQLLTDQDATVVALASCHAAAAFADETDGLDRPGPSSAPPPSWDEPLGTSGVSMASIPPTQLSPSRPAAAEQLERAIFIRTLFAGAAQGRAARLLAAAVKDVRVPAGEVIYRRGESADHIFFVVSGTMSLHSPDSEPWTFGPQAVVGVLDAWMDRPRDRTAIAETDVVALALPMDDWLDVMEDDFELARGTMVEEAKRQLYLVLEAAPTGAFAEPDAALAPSDSEDAKDGLSAAADAGRKVPIARLRALMQCPAFARAGVLPLISLARAADQIDLAAGDPLFRQGDDAGVLHVVRSGRIEVNRDEPVMGARFGRGGLVGGPSSLGHDTFAFTARAVTAASVIAIRHEDLFDVMEDHVEVLRSVFAYLASERDHRQTDRTGNDRDAQSLPSQLSS